MRWPLNEKEIDTLENVLKTEKPLTAIVGGAKISTKLNLLNLIKVDYLVVGGGMANTFLFAQGTQIGKSLCEKNLKETTQRIISKQLKIIVKLSCHMMW